MSEALTTWTRGWYLCIEFKMVCKIMVMMTSIDHDGDEGVDEEIAVIDDEYENMYC